MSIIDVIGLGFYWYCIFEWTFFSKDLTIVSDLMVSLSDRLR